MSHYIFIFGMYFTFYSFSEKRESNDVRSDDFAFRPVVYTRDWHLRGKAGDQFWKFAEKKRSLTRVTEFLLKRDLANKFVKNVRSSRGSRSVPSIAYVHHRPTLPYKNRPRDIYRPRYQWAINTNREDDLGPTVRNDCSINDRSSCR